MALIFRKYFWLVNGAFILCVALLAARTANLFVELAIVPPIDGTPSSRASAASPSKEARVSLDGPRLANLLGLNFGKDEPTVVEPKPEVATGPIRSALRVKLLGTLVASDTQWSLA